MEGEGKSSSTNNFYLRKQPVNQFLPAVLSLALPEWPKPPDSLPSLAPSLVLGPAKRLLDSLREGVDSDGAWTRGVDAAAQLIARFVNYARYN